MAKRSIGFAAISRTVVFIVSLIMIAGVTVMAFADPTLPIRTYQFNPLAIITLASAAVNFALLFYFARKSGHGEERTWLLFYLAGIALYTLTYGLQEMSTNPHGALFWGAMGSISALFAPSLYLFAVNYTNQSERRFPGLIVTLVVAGGLVLLYETLTNIIFVNNTKYAVLQPWGYDFRSAAGPGILLFILWAETAAFAALARLISFRRHTENAVLRRQSLIFIIAVGITGIGSVLLDVLLPSFGVTSLPPFSVLLGTPAAMALVYGVLRYRIATVSPSMFANTILGIMQEAVVVTDDKFDVLYTNERALSLLGARSDASHRASLETYLRPGSLEPFRAAFRGAAEHTGSQVDIPQVDIGPAHQSPVPVRIVGSRSKLGDTNTWIMALSDITRELQTRSVIEHEVQVRTKELQEARAYLLSSINSLEQGFVLLNAKLGVEVINGAARTVFGMKPTTSANSLDELSTEGWDTGLAEAVRKVTASKRNHKFDVATVSGSFLQVFVSPVLLEEHILGIAIIIQDVTEQRILDRSKDEFFSIASHELRTPLTAIRGNMSMIRDYFKDALKDEGLAAMVTDTHDASVRLIAIVNDFLDSSRLEQGKMQFNIQPIALAPVIDSIQKDLGTLLEKQKDTLKVEGVSKLPKVMADEGRARQIIYNLLSNAIKYSADATITLSGSVSGDKLKLSVTDTGKGISPENQKLLFHKFQQAGDPLTRDDTKGTGLGLYISRLLAKNMHGDVELEHSEEGKGSTFVITLPLAK